VLTQLSDNFVGDIMSSSPRISCKDE